MYSHWQRDIASEMSGVKNSFSSWDQCMEKAYCKWPVIVGIIVGSLILLSLVWCLVRCICCGAECCCACLSCFSCCTSCCGNRSNRNRGYAQTAPSPQFPQHTQYQPAPAPVYAQPQYGQPMYGQPHYGQSQYGQPQQHARFDAPSNTRGQSNFNEDALPAMPSWEQSRTIRQADDLEMGQIAQSAPMIPKTANAHVQQYPYHSNAGYEGDIAMSGGMNGHQYGYGQRSPSPYQSRVHSPAHEPSIAPPPSYHTTAPAVARKPIAGSWRDL